MKKLIIGIVGSLIVGLVATGVEMKVANNKPNIDDLGKVSEVKVEEVVDDEESEIEENQEEQQEIVEEDNTETEIDTTQKVEEIPKSTSTAKTQTKSNDTTTQKQVETPKQKESKPQEKTQTTTSNTQNNSSNNNVSTSFYDSITHGQKEFATESACFAKGTEIQNKELDYVLNWNEEHPDNQIQPDINYFRCYPVIDENGEGWYLHFFCRTGEGNDAKLKSMF